MDTKRVLGERNWADLMDDLWNENFDRSLLPIVRTTPSQDPAAAINALPIPNSISCIANAVNVNPDHPR